MSLMADVGMATIREQSKERKDKAHKELACDWTCEITPLYFQHNYITKMYYAGFDPVLAMWMLGHVDYVRRSMYTSPQESAPSKEIGGYGLDVRYEEGSQQAFPAGGDDGPLG